LRFLVEQKDLRIKKNESELTKLKSKLDKALSKIYMPSQDEVIEGLSHKENALDQQHNILRGHEQRFDMTHPLSKHHHDMSEVMRDDEGGVGS
jgi:DNA repair exonuclease SbcCD ATPase subunit